MAKVAVLTKTPPPYGGHFVHPFSPLSQGIMPQSQSPGQSLRLYSSISVVLLFREHRRYFYVNDRSGASQWDFPTEEDKSEDLKDSQGTQMTGQEDTKTSDAVDATGQSFSTIAAAQTTPLHVLFSKICIKASEILFIELIEFVIYAYVIFLCCLNSTPAAQCTCPLVSISTSSSRQPTTTNRLPSTSTSPTRFTATTSSPS